MPIIPGNLTGTGRKAVSLEIDIHAFIFGILYVFTTHSAPLTRPWMIASGMGLRLSCVGQVAWRIGAQTSTISGVGVGGKLSGGPF